MIYISDKKKYDKILTRKQKRKQKRHENKDLHSNVVKFVTNSSGFIPLMKEVEDQQLIQDLGLSTGIGTRFSDYGTVKKTASDTVVACISQPSSSIKLN